MLKLHTELGNPGLAVVHCTGRMVAGERNLARLVAILDCQEPRIALDLGEVEAMDAAGVGALADLLRRAQDSGRELVLWNLGAHVREVLVVTGVGELFQGAVEAGARVA
ncbi:MAG TPA: STAS domain-containing protein [Terriglobales bacterium]|jgi:anti-anti-sigma factor|nr:STAS domain-containing protein [Terriglobales bacterium]